MQPTDADRRRAALIHRIAQLPEHMLPAAEEAIAGLRDAVRPPRARGHVVPFPQVDPGVERPAKFRAQ